MILLLSSQSFAGWLIYHKPEFKGRLIDTETKEPIEGAVVVVVYMTHPIISGPGGGSATEMDIKETLTDKNGEFFFPAYTSLMQPLAKEDTAGFIIFKPGYLSYPNISLRDYKIKQLEGMSLPNVEKFFLKENFGRENEVVILLIKENKHEFKKVTVVFGIVELPKLKTKEERKMAHPGPVGDESLWKKQKQFIEMIRQEWEFFTGKPAGDLYKIDGER
jgi:hypothetical protein